MIVRKFRVDFKQEQDQMESTKMGFSGTTGLVAFLAAAVFVVGCGQKEKDVNAAGDNEPVVEKSRSSSSADKSGKTGKDAAVVGKARPVDPNAPQLQALLHDTKKSHVNGSITTFANSIAGIDVGMADGVKEGMVFAVFHGERFIGRLKIVEVNGTYSAGDFVDRKADPIAGDFVIEE